MVFVTGRRRLSRSGKDSKATCLAALSGDTGCNQLDHSPTCSSLRLHWLRVTARRPAARSIFVSQDVPQVFQSIEIEHWWWRWRMPRLIAVVQIPADFPGGERQT